MRLPARFPVVCGPTAGGKTAAAVALAHLLRDSHGFGAEIVTADAFQVYRGMDIGTAKPTLAERQGVPHHLIDVVEPSERFTLDQWLNAAEAKITELRERGVLPIVVGGTHLYIKALMEGLFEGPGADASLRAELEAMDPAARRAELERVDPAAAGRIHANDVRRTVRALEVYRLTGRAISDHQGQWDRRVEGEGGEGRGGGRPDALLVSLQWPTEMLNRRINLRVKQMMERGLLNEVRHIQAGGGFGPQAGEALGYKQLCTLLNKHPEPSRILLEEAVERIKIETRRFGKNQRTWVKRLSLLQGSLAVDASSRTAGEIAQTIANAILTHQ
ncbi:MAG TPA: tRNA (adenosine(37)-N6)-dimethylallyltransferase MiaA [Phycisphaerales bacterium]|nr:tRNA (adenosine(37)-N6)-dimethylallyltransferase MiaA [Phycisphaerales bacterium]